MVSACLIWLAWIVTPACGNEVPQVSNDYVLRVWELENGMPDHHINSITRTQDGYLWFTTLSGLVRFDGVRFQLMGKKELPGLPSPWVTPVFAASDGSLWLGLDQGGIARRDRNGEIRSILPVQSRPTSASWATSFVEDASGAVWFGSGHEARVFQWKNGVLRSFATTDGVPSGTRVFVCASAAGSIWCCTNGGIARFDGNGFVTVHSAPSAGYRIARRAAGGIWSIHGGKIHAWNDDGTESVVIDVGDSLTKSYVQLLQEDREGGLWIGTYSSGLLRFQDGILTSIPVSISHISALMEDDEGTIWVGTWGGGLNRLTRRRFFMHEPRPGSQDVGLSSICTDAKGRLWAVDEFGIPSMKPDGPGSTFGILPEWNPRDRAIIVHPDALGNVWIGTTTGLIHWTGGMPEREPLKEDVLALLEEEDGGLWAATGQNLFHRRSGHFEALPKTSLMTDVRAMAKDSSGRAWFGTLDGRVFYIKDGLPTEVKLPDNELYWNIRFIQAENDQVWIGSLLGGLYCWKNGQVTRLPTDPALPLAEIRSLFIRPAGNGAARAQSPDDEFWFGTAQGLFSTSRKEIERRMRGEDPEIAAMRYGVNEGLPNLEFIYGGANGNTKTPDGHLWFATNRGALELVPDSLRPNSVATGVMIEDVLLDQKSAPMDQAGGLALPPNPGLLRIHYTLPELASPEQVLFRYRLIDGYERDWNFAGNSREAAFTGLSPGRYHFEVAAAVGSGPWLPGTASLDFTVQAAWWQTASFKTVMILTLMAAVWGGVVLRARAKIRRLKQQRAVERERTRIARDMHDEIGANLTHIASSARLAQLDDPATTGAHLMEISKTARETVDALDEIVWAVTPRYDSLAGTIEYLGKLALRITSATSIHGELDLPGDVPSLPLPANTRHHLLLVVKEALHNAVKHSNGTKIHLAIRFQDGKLTVVIDDDGVGFSTSSSRIGSNGLTNMCDRMEALGGSIDFQTSPENGGRVLLNLPLLPHHPGGKGLHPMNPQP
jgi:signal transduction histidine kinase/ligand-binding sensor domain-containing protein